MTAPATVDLVVRIGDTKTVTVTITDTAGTPVNITGRTYAAQIRARAADTGTPVASFTCTVPTGTDGSVVCTLSAATTAALTPLAGVWDFQETNGTTVTTILAGKVTVVQDVTR